MKCRHCHSELKVPFLDLGNAPPSNAYLSDATLHRPEITYSLKVWVCTNCWLVQTEDYKDPDELFDAEYAYFSSTSSSWLAHAEQYCQMITKRLGISRESFVVELASNDGYLLRNFVANGIDCLGVEPTEGTAKAARAIGVPVLQDFFGETLAHRICEKYGKADLVLGNNVYAHVPDINDFTRGIACLLKPEGVVTLEFPHLLELIRHNQFDTIYHEHFSYLSLGAVNTIFQKAGLRLFDVEKLFTHGGSLRVYGCLETASHEKSNKVGGVLEEERLSGMKNEETYRGFQICAEKVKNDFLRFLLDTKAAGKTVAGYGAAAKGNTLMNFAGIRSDLLPFVCDASPSKIGKYLPGSHIPILPPSAMEQNRPDYIFIFPWNIAPEIMIQNKNLSKQGSQFVVAVPELRFIK